MEGKEKVILHITPDIIWFDKIYPNFEKMEGYKNIYLLDCINTDKSRLCYIKSTEKVICASSLEDWGKIIGDSRNDVIYFHSLTKYSIAAVNFIRKEAVVMWWCFGYEIYENAFGRSPLLPVKVYKPRTFRYYLKHSKSFKSFVSRIMVNKIPRLYDIFMSVGCGVVGKTNIHKKMLNRIDYAFTPLPIEFEELKKRHAYIKAKPYRLRGSAVQWPFDYKEKEGNILFEHSSMLSNNPFDLLYSMKKLHLNGRNVYAPLSYGNVGLVDFFKKNDNIAGADIHVITEMIPANEYIQLISNCSHALFGMIRQSGLGNAYIMLRKGVKMFYYEDSIMYKHFKREGYYVFSIEKDLNDESIKTPLTEEMALHNYNLFYKNFETKGESYQQQFDRILGIKEQNAN